MLKHTLPIIVAISLFGFGCNRKEAVNPFSVASSYQEEGSDVLALAEYEKLATLPKNPDHQFWAMLQVGLLKEELGYPDNEIEDAFHLCHTLFPQRAEGAYYLSKIYHKQNRYSDAYQLEKKALSQAKPPEKESPIALSWIYEYGLLFQLSLSSYYVGVYQESINLCDQLLKLKNLPTNFKEQTVKNRKYPEQKITKLRAQGPKNAIYSLLQTARLKAAKSVSQETVIANYNQAANIAPNIDSHYYLSKFYTKQKMDEEAYEAALEGKKLLSSPAALVLESWVQEYGMLATYAYTAWKLGKFEEAVEAVKIALQSPKMSPDHRKGLKRSLTYYQSGEDIFELAQNRWGTLPWEKTNEH